MEMLSLAIAAALRPLGALVMFTAALCIAWVIRPLIPGGKIKDLLYDRTFRKRHPWKVFLVFALVFYGTVAAVGWYVYR